MTGHDIIVIGASAGGMHALKQIVRGLPADLAAAVFVVWHVAPHHDFILPKVLAGAGRLPTAVAEDGRSIQVGTIRLAPPNRHLLLENGRTRLTCGPKENRSRPAIDALFRSAAYSYGSRVIGVVLTGMLDDGTAGLWAIKDRGGLAIVQDPLDAEYPSMPRNAFQYVQTANSVPLQEITPLITRLSREPAMQTGEPAKKELAIETNIGLGQNATKSGVMDLGTWTPFTCPECHGTLMRLNTGGIPRFRCHTGHAYSIQSLLADLSESTENTLWSSVRSFEEIALLAEQMSEHLRAQGEEENALSFAKQGQNALRNAEAIRQIVTDRSAETG